MPERPPTALRRNGQTPLTVLKPSSGRDQQKQQQQQQGRPAVDPRLPRSFQDAAQGRVPLKVRMCGHRGGGGDKVKACVSTALVEHCEGARAYRNPILGTSPRRGSLKTLEDLPQDLPHRSCSLQVCLGPQTTRQVISFEDRIITYEDTTRPSLTLFASPPTPSLHPHPFVSLPNPSPPLSRLPLWPPLKGVPRPSENEAGHLL